MKSPHVTIFVSFSGHGGVEKMIVNLTQGFIDQGCTVDLLLAKAKGEHLAAVPPQVRMVKLNSKHTATSLLALTRYLKQHRPDAILVAKDRAIKVAVLARWLSRVPTRIVGRLGTTVSAALEGHNGLKKFFWYQSMRWFYRKVDCIVAVSDGVRNDVLAITQLPEQRIGVIRNPVVTPTLQRLAKEPVQHPWLTTDASMPVIIAVGRLTRQKDFVTLLKAFAQLRSTRLCRLIILGEGKDREALLQLANALGIVNDLDLPGFVTNPYAYLSRASLFVLSSLWEGSPNVLTEALALGIPVVATDCPSGPKEILENGTYGRLVKMRDANAMAQAMADTLDQPLPAEQLQQAVQAYRLPVSSQHYLRVLGLARPKVD